MAGPASISTCPADLINKHHSRTPGLPNKSAWDEICLVRGERGVHTFPAVEFTELSSDITINGLMTG